MNTIKTKPSSLWVSLIGLLAVLVLLGVFAQTARRNNGTLVLTINPTVMTSVIPSGSPPPSVTITPEMEPTEGATEDWSATETAWPITQVAARVTFEAWQTANPYIEPTPITGFADFEGPIRNKNHMYKSGWGNYFNGEWLLLHTGAYSADPTQGIVAIWFGLEVYETPIKVGALRIVAEQNYRLTLVSTDGTIFYFDIPGRRFVESLTEIAPTITPIIPSLTPTPTITPTFNPTWLTPWPTCTPIPPSNATAGPCGP